MTGNWLQEALNWYWITPWQLAGFMALFPVAAVALTVHMNRRLEKIRSGVSDGMFRDRAEEAATDDDADWQNGYRSDDGSTSVEHRDGIEWAGAPLPPRRHECRAQTRGYTGHFNYIERCACGAARLRAYGPWMEKNQTRLHKERSAA